MRWGGRAGLRLRSFICKFYPPTPPYPRTMRILIHICMHTSGGTFTTDSHFLATTGVTDVHTRGSVHSALRRTDQVRSPICKLKAIRAVHFGVPDPKSIYGLSEEAGLGRTPGGYILLVSWPFHSMEKGTDGENQGRVLRRTKPRANTLL